MAAADEFNDYAREKAFDQVHYHRMEGSGDSYQQNFRTGSSLYRDIELARNRAAHIKWKTLENLDKYLIEFETHMLRNGGKVLWATDTQAALREIGDLLQKYPSELVLKSKSTMADEIGLDEFLKSQKVEKLSTNFGDYIQQLAGEKSYHMVSSAVHKTREDILSLLHKHLGTHEASTNEEMIAEVRTAMRKKFREAGIAISGANFLVAETGQVAITENEGNALLGMTFPRVQIVLASIEKIIPSLNDLDTMWPLLSVYGTGQHMATYNSLISGPAQPNEMDGPSELYVILVDNGRSALLGQPEQRSALSCIRCGACANVCPVYRHIGGHGYQTSYPGPIGKVINPYLNSFEEYHHQAYASPLCGSCRDVCPVKIDIPHLLLRARQSSIEKKLGNSVDNYTWKQFTKVMLDRKRMNQKASLKNLFLKLFFAKRWGSMRQLPVVVEKSFNQRWRELHP